MRHFGIRLVLSVLVLGSIMASALSVHALWWRTAQNNSRALAETLNSHVTQTVRKEYWNRVAEAEAAFQSIRSLITDQLVDGEDPAKRHALFVSTIMLNSTLSWTLFATLDGRFEGVHRQGENHIEAFTVSKGFDGNRLMIERFLRTPDGPRLLEQSAGPVTFDVRMQAWFGDAVTRSEARWHEIRDHVTGPQPAVAYAAAIRSGDEPLGVLAVVIELARLARFLGEIEVGRTGAAFLLGPDGRIVIRPDKRTDATDQADPVGTQLLDPVALETGKIVAARPDSAKNIVESRRVVVDGAGYAVALSPLEFKGWQFAIIIPEKEFLGEIDRVTWNLSLWLIVFVSGAALFAAWLGRRMLAEPIRAVVADLGRIERFEFAGIARRRSRLTEVDQLSSALVHMGQGLSAFAKYIPTDLVRMLVADGIEAKPGGEQRPLTIVFADVEGFTGLSERMGERVFPLIGAYFDIMSRVIEAEQGTIDKFIGDAVMAFWNAPRATPDHALAACRAALAAGDAIRAANLTDDTGRPIGMRIGINSGTVLVGNVGSARRLNYTAIGDAVNIASRLESANKIYGTRVLIGEETRRLAGDAILVRELDRVAVYGRAGGIAVFELLGLAAGGAALPEWATIYQRALALFRDRRFDEALPLFAQVVAMRGEDGPSGVMLERCRTFLTMPPAPDWSAVHELQRK